MIRGSGNEIFLSYSQTSNMPQLINILIILFKFNEDSSGTFLVSKTVDEATSLSKVIK